MRVFVIIFALLFTLCSFGQDIETKKTSHDGKTSKTRKRTHTRALMPLKYYKQKFKKPLTKKDTLNFVYRDNDTLVVIVDYKPKGISVPYEYKDSTFLDIYTKIAFKYAHDSLKNESKMKYWKDNISIYFAKEIPKKSKKKFLDFADNIISQVDSLNIKEVKRVEDSNYIVYYSGSFEYESRMENYTGSDFYMHWNGNNQIYKVVLRIKSDHLFNENLRLIEMKRLFFQSLGLFQFNTELDCSNYFSGCYNENSTLSDLDLELINYHYSYGICKGTNYETFMMQHKKTKETLREKNILMGFLHEK